MLLKIFSPTPPLDEQIAFYTYYTRYAPDYTSSRVLPDGSTDLLILLEDIPRVFHRSNKKPFTCKNTIISGVQLDHVFAEAAGHSVFGIKFKPGGSYPFFHVPLFELNNLYLEADLLLGSRILLLREQLMALGDPQAMVRLVEQFLLEQLMDTCQPTRMVAAAVAQLKQVGQPGNLKQLSENVGYSQKQFIQIFKQHVGVTPKYYQRIARFNRVLTEVDTQQSFSWSRVAHACGFYDQSHLINDFKRLSGMGPSDYLLQRGEFLNFVPIYPNT